MPFPCPRVYKEKSKQNLFYSKCGTEVFKSYPESWNNIDRSYIEHINNIKDPILRHIFIYFVKYYIDGYHYYHDSGQTHRSEACQYLNRWLQEKKDLFTYGQKCPKKLNLWTEEIKILWDKLKINEYFIPDVKDTRKPWCDKIDYIDKTTFPDTFTPPNCEESISQVFISANCPPPPDKEECICSPSEVPVTLAQTDELSGTDRTKNLAVTSGFTAAGTLGTLFFLYRFTPMMSWFRRPGMNNVGTDLYMNPGGAESFLSMQHGNGGNNLFYQP